MKTAIAPGAVAALLLCAAPALAAPPNPILINPIYVDHPAATADGPAKAPLPATCKVAITGVTDARRPPDPDIAGVVGGRAVRTPTDSVAWTRSILGGLEARGVKPEFVEAPPADGPSATVALKVVWVTTMSTNKSGTVVLRLRADKGGAVVIDKDYRGAMTNLNWAFTTKEFQELVDMTFGLALDQMAVDLKGLCA